MADTRVVYIAGAGRSGSTLVAGLLGSIEGFLNAGEVRYLFSSRMRSRSIPCGCGHGVEDCEWWQGLAPIIGDDLVEYATGALTLGKLPRMVAGELIPRLRGPRHDALVAAARSLYAGMAGESGADFVVDSSKHPAFALFLSEVLGADLRVVHLVRDPRGVVASWSKPKGYLRSHAPGRIIFDWMAYNIASEYLRTRATYMRVTYEEFILDPPGVLGRILRFAGADPGGVDGLGGDGTFNVSDQHALSGNPGKFLVGGRVDVDHRPWVLSLKLQALTTAATWPLMVRYGYRLGRRAAA